MTETPEVESEEVEPCRYPLVLMKVLVPLPAPPHAVGPSEDDFANQIEELDVNRISLASRSINCGPSPEWVAVARARTMQILGRARYALERRRELKEYRDRLRDELTQLDGLLAEARIEFDVYASRDEGLATTAEALEHSRNACAEAKADVNDATLASRLPWRMQLESDATLQLEQVTRLIESTRLAIAAWRPASFFGKAKRQRQLDTLRDTLARAESSLGDLEGRLEHDTCLAAKQRVVAANERLLAATRIQQTCLHEHDIRLSELKARFDLSRQSLPDLENRRVGLEESVVSVNADIKEVDDYLARVTNPLGAWIRSMLLFVERFEDPADEEYARQLVNSGALEFLVDLTLERMWLEVDPTLPMEACDLLLEASRRVSVRGFLGGEEVKSADWLSTYLAQMSRVQSITGLPATLMAMETANAIEAIGLFSLVRCVHETQDKAAHFSDAFAMLHLAALKACAEDPEAFEQNTARLRVLLKQLVSLDDRRSLTLTALRNAYGHLTGALRLESADHAPLPPLTLGETPQAPREYVSRYQQLAEAVFLALHGR